MRKFLIAIASHLGTAGQESFSLTLNPHDQDGTTSYETIGDLKQTLIDCLPETENAGLDSIIGTIEKKGSMHFQASLSDENAVRLGYKVIS
jgi:hypothetical protein